MIPYTQSFTSPEPDEHVVLMPSVPMHTQIRERIRQQILNGSYQPLSQMPSEAQMMDTYSVSRITIRQALGDLQKEGLIFKVPGKGSFVAKPKAFQNLSRLQGFGEAMAPSGYETYSKVLSMRQIAATETIRQRLQLNPNTDVIEIQRLRYLNREPISLDQSYFPLEVGERLMREDLSTRDVFAILENQLGWNISHADVQIEAITADDFLARQLGVMEASPLLRIERLTYANNKPIDFEFLYYRGDAFQYRLRIDRT
jgi:GntR family transcriptional regulator